MENIKEIVRENLVKLRKERKLTQIELSQKIGYSDKAISRWETGEVTPDVETLNALAELYGIPIAAFFEKYTPERPKSVDERQQIVRKVAVALLGIACVWFFAIIGFSRLGVLFHNRSWLVFIWAIPLSFAVAIYCNVKWGKRIVTLILASGLCWTFLLAIYLQFAEFHTFMTFVSGVPIQIGIILLAFIRPTGKHTAEGG